VYIYGNFGREITKYTVIHGVYIRVWPTIYIYIYICACAHPVRALWLGSATGCLLKTDKGNPWRRPQGYDCFSQRSCGNVCTRVGCLLYFEQQRGLLTATKRAHICRVFQDHICIYVHKVDVNLSTHKILEHLVTEKRTEKTTLSIFGRETTKYTAIHGVCVYIHGSG